jgi:hypothetical protein
MQEKSEQNQTNTSQQSEFAESKAQESSVSHSQQVGSDQSSEAKTSFQTTGEKEDASFTKHHVHHKVDKKRQKILDVGTGVATPNIVNKVADQNQQTNKDSIPNISDGIS